MPDPLLHGVPVTPDMLRGALAPEGTDRGLVPHRLPSWARAQNADPQLATAEAMPAGVRLAVRTAASVLEVEAHATRRTFAGLPERPPGAWDVLVDGRHVVRGTPAGGSVLTYDLAAGTVTSADGPSGVLRVDLPDGEHDVEVWLPHGELVELLAVRADAPLAAQPPSGRRTWVHHGSSISQGSDAAGPCSTWVALAARAGDLDLVNLGFSGSMMLDPLVARTMRDAAADVISIEVGINIVGGDAMRMRVFTPLLHGFLDLLRDGHPDVPIVLVTPLCCPMHEDTPGPSGIDPQAWAAGRVRYRALGDPADVADGRLTLRSLRAEVERVVAQRRADDPHLHVLDGLRLYGPDDQAAHALPDGLHPDGPTHELIASRFSDLVLATGGPFASR